MQNFKMEMTRENKSLHFMENVSLINARKEETNEDFLLILLDRSQLVMTIVGIIANAATFVTLRKNKKVGDLQFVSPNHHISTQWHERTL